MIFLSWEALAGYERQMDILVLKWVHIISSTILFGTGIGSAFYMFMANRRGKIEAICFATRHVVIADWMFTTPAIVIQFLTGVGLVYLSGYSFGESWIVWALVLYFFAGACWLPVVWIQIKMRDIAARSLADDTNLPDAYWRLDKWWIGLGALAFPAVLAIFWLMVFKPAL